MNTAAEHTIVVVHLQSRIKG